jgi:hypothetical protein
VALAVSAPAWPDDWDGIGFLQSVRDFDLARFRPHPPGYPVYVALLRVADLLARDPMRASVAVAAGSAATAVWFVWAATRRVAGAWAAWAAAALVAVLPIVWHASSGVGSEAPAFACAAACAWGLVANPVDRRQALRAALALGLGAGLGLGVRLSWAPLYVAALAVAPRPQRVRAWGVAALGSAAWAAPLVALVGPSRLHELVAEQLAGHLGRWGGTVATQPGMVRIGWLARDVFADGFGAGSDHLGIAIAVLVAAGCLAALAAWSRARWVGWRAAVVAAGPYLVWVAFGQNLRDQPRHVLPLVVLLAVALVLRAARSPRALAIVCALTLLAGMRTARDAIVRRCTPPAGEQLVELVRAQPAADRPAVFGVASVRFFELSELASDAFPAGSLGDVQLRLARMGGLPPRVWITSEVEREGDPRWPLERVATLCRPARLDRRAPCLDVDEWKLPDLPRR